MHLGSRRCSVVDVALLRLPPGALGAERLAPQVYGTGGWCLVGGVSLESSASPSASWGGLGFAIGVLGGPRLRHRRFGARGWSCLPGLCLGAIVSAFVWGLFLDLGRVV
jgi:hypothetical protein